MSKILVICFSSINNVAMAIPVIHSLATQYAQHQIMVLSIDTFSPLFENVPDNVIFRGADFRGEHAGLMGLGWLYNDLKEEKFDAVAAFQPFSLLAFSSGRHKSSPHQAEQAGTAKTDTAET